MAPPAGYLTSGAIEGVLVLLNATYPGFTQLIPFPETSVEHRVIRALRIRAGGGERNGVLLVGGHHGRELINPDLLVGLAYKLCWAYDNNLGITLGNKVWLPTDIRLIVEGLDIFIVPNVNPDGREYVRVSSDLNHEWWRKNRGFNADGSRGADLNRNYDFLWEWKIGLTSDIPTEETYRGDAPFSEPETRNVRWLLDTYPDIAGFVDVHSYSELVLFPWGDDDNQSTDPSQNFLNPTWDDQRGDLGGYAEYIPAADHARFADVGNKMRAAIAAARDRAYKVQQGFDLYGTSGVSSDYAYSRFFRPGGKRKVWAFAIECNRSDFGRQYGFQPPYADALEVMKEVQSGLIQLLLSCLCVAREVGRSVAVDPETFDGLRRFRDTDMMESARGRKWADLIETHGEEILLLLGKDDKAWDAAGKIFSPASAIVQGRASASPPKIDRALVTQMQRLAARIEKRASPHLKKALAEVSRDLRKVVGKTARQVLG